MFTVYEVYSLQTFCKANFKVKYMHNFRVLEQFRAVERVNYSIIGVILPYWGTIGVLVNLLIFIFIYSLVPQYLNTSIEILIYEILSHI
jgi:hypothetical protein